MIDEDLLRDLGTAGVGAEPRPMVEIAGRARQIRTRRRVGRAGTALVTVGLLAGLAVPVWRLQDRLAVPAGGGGLDCSRSESATTRLDAYPELAYLPPTELTPRLYERPPKAVRVTPACPTPSARGTWFSLSDGTVGKRLTVRGPGYPAPGAAETEESHPEAVDVGGRNGLISNLPGSKGWVWWRDADGFAWRADGTGMTRDQLLDAVRSIAVRDGQVAVDRVPDGLATAVPGDAGPPGGDGAQVTFQLARSQQWTLLVAQFPDSSWQAGAGFRPLEVNGAPAWSLSGTDPTSVVLMWQLAPGVLGQLTGQGSVADAVHLAEATRKVSVDDPRFAARR